jgi:hypothetical protein
VKLSIKRNSTSDDDDLALIRKHRVSVINMSANPPGSVERDTDFGLDTVRQIAEADARSGAWDLHGVMSLGSQFPSEDLIESEIERRRLDHQNTLRIGLVNSDYLNHDAEHLAVSIDGKLTSLAQENRALEQARGRLDDLQTERNKDVEVLEGRAVDGMSTPWTGPVPTPPVLNKDDPLWRSRVRLALRPDRAKQFFLDIGLTLLALGVEAILIKESIALLRRDEGWFGYLYAIPPLIVVTVLPHVIGKSLAAATRRKSFNRQEMITLIIAVPAWLATAYLLGDLRTQATEYRTRSRIAKQTGVTIEEVPSDVLNEQFHHLQVLFLWTILIAAVGVALLVLKIMFYNPYVTKVLKVDSQIAIAQRNLAVAEQESERITSQVEIQKKSTKTTINSWDHYIDVVLPAHALELKAHYRICLINAFADPDMATAILAVPKGEAYGFATPPTTVPTDTKSIIEKELSSQ